MMRCREIWKLYDVGEVRCRWKHFGNYPWLSAPCSIDEEFLSEIPLFSNVVPCDVIQCRGMRCDDALHSFFLFASCRGWMPSTKQIQLRTPFCTRCLVRKLQTRPPKTRQVVATACYGWPGEYFHCSLHMHSHPLFSVFSSVASSLLGWISTKCFKLIFSIALGYMLQCSDI